MPRRLQYDKLLGPDNEHTLLAMQGYAHVLTKTEQWKDAAEASGRVYDAMVQRGNASPMQRLVSLNTQAFALMRAGDVEDGVRRLKNELAGFKDDSATGRIAVLASHINLAHGLMDLGREEEAAPLIEGLAGDEGAMLRKLDTDAAGEIALLHGWLQRERGQSTESQASLASALELLRKKNDEGYWLCRKVVAIQAPSAEI